MSSTAPMPDRSMLVKWGQRTTAQHSPNARVGTHVLAVSRVACSQGWDDTASRSPLHDVDIGK